MQLYLKPGMSGRAQPSTFFDGISITLSAFHTPPYIHV